MSSCLLPQQMLSPSHCFFLTPPTLPPGPLSSWKVLPPWGLRSGLWQGHSQVTNTLVSGCRMHTSAQPKATKVPMRFICTCFSDTELPSQELEPSLPSSKLIPLLSQGGFLGSSHTSLKQSCPHPGHSCPSAWMPKDQFLRCGEPISITWNKTDGECCLLQNVATPTSRRSSNPHL